MYALVLAALVGGGQEPTRPATGTGGRETAAHVTLDGTWTVVAFERNGSAVEGVTTRPATIKGSALSFGSARSGTERPAETGDGTALGGMRIEFGPRGTVRVTELPAGAAATDRPAATTDIEARTGVYVLSRDYLAICIHNDRGAGAGAARPAPGTGADRPKTAPAAGTAAADGPGVGPEMRSYLTVLLKRSESAGSEKDRK